MKTNNLPNYWSLSSLFIKKNIGNLKYCTTQETFFIYKDNIWIQITKGGFSKLFIDFLPTSPIGDVADFPDSYQKFNIQNIESIIKLVTLHTSSKATNNYISARCKRKC